MLFKIIVFILLTGFLSIASFQYFVSPELFFLKQKREKLLSLFEEQQNTLVRYKNHLAQLQIHDEKIYRPYLNKASVPLSIRQAGMGGSEEEYEHIVFLGNGLVADILSDINSLQAQFKIQGKSFGEIAEALDEKADLHLCLPAIQPVSVNDLISISSYFGVRYHPIHGSFLMHDGIDFTGRIGTPIYASGKGQIIEIKHSATGYGNEIIIDHGHGFQTRYAHLHEIFVEEGQQVKRGEQIATLGNTGNSTGPHLHYEVIQHGKKMDPINYFYDNLSNLEYEKIVKNAE